MEANPRVDLISLSIKLPPKKVSGRAQAEAATLLPAPFEARLQFGQDIGNNGHN
jgi:hypothetical protein